MDEVTQRRRDGLTSPDTDGWLPVLHQGERVTLHWCELPNSVAGDVPVTVADFIHVPDLEPVWRSPSIAVLIESIAELAELDFWVNTDGHDWHYRGPYGRFPWLC